VIRPSLKHPTLELRVADSCTRVDDTIAIAALYRCLVRRLSLDPKLNAGQTGAWQLRRRDDTQRQACP
jgi:carboxylate-amine ligase